MHGAEMFVMAEDTEDERSGGKSMNAVVITWLDDGVAWTSLLVVGMKAGI
jgi:hypothetical protein